MQCAGTSEAVPVDGDGNQAGAVDGRGRARATAGADDFDLGETACGHYEGRRGWAEHTRRAIGARKGDLSWVGGAAHVDLEGAAKLNTAGNVKERRRGGPDRMRREREGEGDEANARVPVTPMTSPEEFVI